MDEGLAIRHQLARRRVIAYYFLVGGRRSKGRAMKTKSLGLVTLRASAIGGFALSVLFIPTGQPVKQTGVIVAYAEALCSTGVYW